MKAVSAQPPRPLCFGGDRDRKITARDAENAEVAQRDE